MKHVIITRFNYDREDKFNERFVIFTQTLLPSLLNQTNKNFTWCLICENKTHREIIKSLYNNDIMFVDNLSQAMKFVKDNHIDIQTRQDNDDMICENYIQTIHDEVNKTDKDVLLIQFQPTKINYKTKEEFHMEERYGNNFVSMFLSLYQKNVTRTVHDYMHPEMYKLTQNIITYPEGCAKMVVHGGNMSNKLNPNDILVKK